MINGNVSTNDKLMLLLRCDAREQQCAKLNNKTKYFVGWTKVSRRYQNDICVNTWDLFKISGLSESEKHCKKSIWNKLKGNKRKPQCYARKSVTKTLTVGLLRDCFLPNNEPFMINDFCSSTNIRLCVSSRLCLNRNKFWEDFCVLEKIRRVTLTVD